MARTGSSKTILNETGKALAVLALWMLLLLAPLHQTSVLLHEMAKAGHDISGEWSICTTLAQRKDGKIGTVPVCPAHGIGKADLWVLLAKAGLVRVLPVPHSAFFSDDNGRLALRQNFPQAQARAPPAQA